MCVCVWIIVQDIMLHPYTYCIHLQSTRQHSSGMCTASFRWSSLDVSTSWGVGPEVSKFEQVSSDYYQMSVAGGKGREKGVGLCLVSRAERVPMHHR